ncbi:cytochrome P450 [Pseudarthrobacter oxydans]|uniref:cytochrome P450 n=1 Tax=Pseudarthrobacter TaxID=1742993 RepID=UPI000CECCFF3|nr:cytochrome P450 [Pseudarthrobacter sp. NCCP-2145]MBD1539596.1 cytochrome P450 [Arthrobacter sp. S13_S34]GKV73735.1 cytochrome P450 [Pseudarthrobacter sp. NCCP-2145]
MSQATLWEQILDPSNRANPYPFYAELRKNPVTKLPDESYVVSTYAEIAALLHDPRVSSDLSRNPAAAAAAAGAAGDDDDDGGILGMTPTFLSMDPPDHDKFRRIAMRDFGPPTTPGRVAGMEPRMTEIVTELIDNMADRTRIDVVDDLAYPLPVTVICELLGVPPGDEQRFRVWVDVALQSTDPGLDPETQQKKRAEAGKELRAFMEELVEAHRQAPGNDMLSAMATGDGPEGRMPADQLVSTGLLLLIAGHETTVNLISNGALTLLRHPQELQKLRNDPDLAIPMVEELLRYEPPVHFLPFRTALDDIDVAGTTIPAGASITMLLAAGNRDPAHVTDPDLFIPDRPNNQHLGFGSGIHICFGAPLARLEAQIALTAFASRLKNPRLVADPPPYRPSPFLRGPSHLPVDIDGIAAATKTAHSTADT